MKLLLIIISVGQLARFPLLLSDIRAALRTVTKKNICNTLCCDGLKSRRTHVQALRECDVVDEAKIEQFLHQFTGCIC